MANEIILPDGQPKMREVMPTVARSDMRRSIIGNRVPQSENARTEHGRNLNVDRIHMAMLQANQGYMASLTDLEDESMAMDPSMCGLMQRRAFGVAASTYEIQPPTNIDVADRQWAKKVNEDVRQMLKRVQIETAMCDASWAVFYGRFAQEVQWDSIQTPFGPRFSPVRLDFIKSRRLSLTNHRRLQIVDTNRSSGFNVAEGGILIDDHPGKFISWMPRLFAEYQEREGLGPRAMYWTFFKRFSWRMRMALIELYAIPWRIVTADPEVRAVDATAEATKAADGLGEEVSAVMPPGYELKVHHPGEGSDGLVGLTSEDVDNQIAKLFLSTDVTTNGEANRANAIVGQNNVDPVFSFDGRGVAGCIQPMCYAYVVQNYGHDAADTLLGDLRIRSESNRDRKAELERVQVAVGLGLPVAQADAREVVGTREPFADEPVLKAPSTGIGAYSTSIGALPTGRLEDEGELSDDPMEESGGDDALARALKDALGMTRAPARGAIVLAQPAAAKFGSPEPAVIKGAVEGTRYTDAWASQLSESVSGAESHAGALAALTRASMRLDLEMFSKAFERQIVRTLMLGAIDSDFEIKNDTTIKVDPFKPIAAAGTTPNPDFVSMPFQEAIRAFKEKGVISRRAFDRLTGAAKRRAFTVAGLTRKAMLETAKAELSTSIAEGDTLATFGKRLSERFDDAGWTKLNNSHVEVIFRNGVMGAYSSGRDAQMMQPEILAAYPFHQCTGVSDPRSRDAHKAAHGKVLSATDPFWRKAPLPWGHNCRCRKVARSAEYVRRLSLQVISGSSLVGLPDDGWDASEGLFG